jgi:Transcriptional regulator containing PAS, AAA-type ATPase, and DNA-binding domains
MGSIGNGINDREPKIETAQNYPRHLLITKEYWESVAQAKEKFLVNSEDLQCSSCVHPKIYASWIRSRSAGVDPYAKPLGRFLSSIEFAEAQDKNSTLINIAKPLIETFEDLTIAAGHVIYLCDKNGVFLLYGGDMIKNSTYFPKGKGLIWNDDIAGTSAHMMSILLKHPVQLIGPEQYCVLLTNTVVSAAPILDEYGDVMGSLVLGQEIHTTPWEDDVRQLCSHTLGLVTAMATSIENKIKLVNSFDKLKIANEQLQVAHSAQEITLSFIDDGIVTIDNRGNILHLNSEVSRLFHLDHSNVLNRNVADFMLDTSHLMHIIQTGKNEDIEERFRIGDTEKYLLVMVRPIINNLDNSIDGAVLKLNTIEKINAFLNSRTGASATYHFENIIGQSKEINKAITMASRFANSPENILLVGESGTGKEIFAQAIHNQHRSRGPFIAINCAAMPRNLIESELFGYERGSFTGAERSGRPGKIELANGGTLFLDEIGDMPFEIQAILLRVLEDKQVMRIGGQNYKKVDFRLVAATNKNLLDMVDKNLFREDLYFRLSVLNVNIPPLRERGADIGILSTYFIKNYCHKMGMRTPMVNPDVWQALIEYSWPGNVRQLENAIIYAVNAAENDVIAVENLPPYILLRTNTIIETLTASSSVNKIVYTPQTNSSERANGDQGNELTLEAAEKRAILAALLHTNNYVPGAADILKISRSTMYRKLKEYNIEH